VLLWLKSIISKCSPNRVLDNFDWHIHVVYTVCAASGSKSVQNKTGQNGQVYIVTHNASASKISDETDLRKMTYTMFRCKTGWRGLTDCSQKHEKIPQKQLFQATLTLYNMQLFVCQFSPHTIVKSFQFYTEAANKKGINTINKKKKEKKKTMSKLPHVTQS